MKTLLFIFFLFPLCYAIAKENPGKNTKWFGKIDIGLDSRSDINYYPIEDGDYWEFIETDTATIVGQYDLNFSVTEEILFDTLLSNGLSYKKIKWNNEANSVNYLPVYEYHRKDSLENVYLFYQGNDYLLFNVNANIGDTYPAHLPGYVWLVADKYNVIGFGDTLAAIDFNLLENGTTLMETYTLVENFGLIYYKKNVHGNQLPEGTFWGAVINGEQFGTIIVNKQQVDWSKFYPLHMGDYWVYRGFFGSNQFVISKRVIGDTLISNGSRFYKILSIDHTFGTIGYSFDMVDSLGNLYTLHYGITEPILKLRFSTAVGDTTWYVSPDCVRRINDKYINLNYNNYESLLFYAWPDITNRTEEYTNNLGRTMVSGDQVGLYLLGAYINGSFYGDTTITSIEPMSNLNPENFKLFQNYPNPFNPVTTIKYSVPMDGNVKLTVYNILGQQVAELVNKEVKAGSYEVEFSAKNLSVSGGDLASGVYFYRITATPVGGQAGDFVLTKKMVLLK